LAGRADSLLCLDFNTSSWMRGIHANCKLSVSAYFGQRLPHAAAARPYFRQCADLAGI
jgi:hypothetical protein